MSQSTSLPLQISNPTVMKKVARFALRYGIYLVFIVLCAVVSIASPVFLTVSNLANVLMQSTAVGIIAVGMTFVIITRGIDVSVGAIVALASAIGVAAVKLNGQGVLSAMLMMVGVGLLIGLVNGFSTAYLRMPAFLVTLATLTIARGFVLSLSGGKWLYDLPPFFQTVGMGTIGPIPNSVLIMVIAFVIGHFLLANTVFGRQVYAIGGNPDAARVSGINVEKVTLIAFAICGVFAGISSIVLTSRLNSFTATMGTGYEFTAIAAVVIGGTSLAGGEGNVGGTLVGVLILGVINNALNLLGVSVYYQDVARGSIIFIAVLLDALRTRYSTTSES